MRIRLVGTCTVQPADLCGMSLKAGSQRMLQYMYSSIAQTFTYLTITINCAYLMS